MNKKFIGLNRAIPVAFNNVDVDRLDEVSINRSRFIRNVVLEAIDEAERGLRNARGEKVVQKEKEKHSGRLGSLRRGKIGSTWRRR